MKQKFYTLPLRAKNLTSRKGHDMCNLNQSIAHHIHLINTSSFGECSFDETFGCSIWLIDFDNLKSSNKLKSQIVESLHNSLQRHEKRLANIKIDVKIKQEELNSGVSANRIKKRIDIQVKGTVKKTNESFSYFEYFYIGPLSY
ncbi:GPW/gp25 family protein [Aureitalea sp. L0-47]|uniref:GPW/gp25 family protein n=1 Tax=Aureitalea sp. L0-47 TaxID=2816962 RepID=UPI002238A4A2|nr:GPW/gp25 family protein [Aureitalea sp. L0-47]MCW5518541.1 GPW/gp25 family protein [Aureitalea sp. L0-47]